MPDVGDARPKSASVLAVSIGPAATPPPNTSRVHKTSQPHRRLCGASGSIMGPMNTGVPRPGGAGLGSGRRSFETTAQNTNPQTRLEWKAVYAIATAPRQPPVQPVPIVSGRRMGRAEVSRIPVEKRGPHGAAHQAMVVAGSTWHTALSVGGVAPTGPSLGSPWLPANSLPGCQSL